MDLGIKYIIIIILNFKNDDRHLNMSHEKN
jgi:hypothetical protein